MLRSVFTLLLYRRKRDELAAASWQDYRTLLRRWEAYWSAVEGRPSRGPDVRQITDQQLREFFAGVPAWRSERSWQKYSDLLTAILKSAARRSDTNRSGLPAGEALLEELPRLEMPSRRWFVERANREGSAATDRTRGGHRPSREPLLTVEEFGRVVEAAAGEGFPGCRSADPLQAAASPRLPVWEALLALLWTYGPRIRDCLRLPREAVDWSRLTLSFRESKKLNVVCVPLAPAVAGVLRPLWSLPGDTIFPLPPGDLANLNRRFYPAYRAIWTRATVPCRMPHQMRATCVSHWKAHAPEWRKWATGHSRGGDVQDQYYVIPGEAFRRAVETFPQPAVLRNG